MKLALGTALVFSCIWLVDAGHAQVDAQPNSSTEALQVIAPDNSAPERDARGIPVISDPATVPAGANLPLEYSGPYLSSPRYPPIFMSQPATEDYGSCSRSVTDNCLQTYERVDCNAQPDHPRCRGWFRARRR